MPPPHRSRRGHRASGPIRNALLFLLLLGAAAAASDIAIYSIRTALDGDLCVSVESGNSIALAQCDKSHKQTWTARELGTNEGEELMLIRGRGSGDTDDKCVEVTDARVGRRLILRECSEEERHQMWSLDGEGRLHPIDSDDLCAEAGSIREGSNLRLEDCDRNRERQLWVFDDRPKDTDDKDGCSDSSKSSRSSDSSKSCLLYTSDAADE